MTKDNRRKYKVYTALVTRSGAFTSPATGAMIGIGRTKKEAFDYIVREMRLVGWEGYPESDHSIEIKEVRTPGYTIDVRVEKGNDN